MQRWILAAVAILAGVLVALAVLFGTHEPPPSNAVDSPTQVAPPAPVEKQRVLILTSVPDSAVVRVRVTSKVDGRPLAGVRVAALAPGKKSVAQRIPLTRDSRGRAQYTGLDGVAELGLDPGIAFTILARFEDRSMSWKSVELDPLVKLDPPLAPDEVRTLELQMQPRTEPTPAELDLVLHARVVDRETGAPIRGARVGRSAGWDAIEPEDERLTDDDGRFVAMAASSRLSVVNVIAAGYGPALVVPIAGHATREFALEIALSRFASARVTVLDANGDPIAGVDANLGTHLFRLARGEGDALLPKPFPAGLLGDATYRARTDEHGIAVFGRLPPGVPLAGWLERGRHEMFRGPEDLTLAPSEARELTWRVGGGCVVRGVALETDGTPAVGLAVALEPAGLMRPGGRYLMWSVDDVRRFALTDRDGRFEFEDVGPGYWWIGPAPEDSDRDHTVGPNDAATRATVVNVTRDAQHVDVDIHVQRGHSISGRVLDPSGAPITMASITFTRPTDETRGHDSTRFDSKGRFQLGPIEEGEYELHANANGFARSETTTARTGDTDVVLQLRAGATIDGVVVDKATGVASAARLTLAVRQPADWFVSLPNTDANGAFRFEGLLPGVYDLTASTSSGLVGVARGVDVAAGSARSLRVEVEPGARVRIHNEVAEGWRSFVVLADGALVAMENVQHGTTAEFVVPAGAVVVHPRRAPDSEDLDLPLTLAVGETRDVVFDGAWK